MYPRLTSLATIFLHPIRNHQGPCTRNRLRRLNQLRHRRTTLTSPTNVTISLSTRQHRYRRLRRRHRWRRNRTRAPMRADQGTRRGRTRSRARRTMRTLTSNLQRQQSTNKGRQRNKAKRRRSRTRTNRRRGNNPRTIVTPRQIRRTTRSNRPTRPLNIALFSPPDFNRSKNKQVLPHTSTHTDTHTHKADVQPQELTKSCKTNTSPQVIAYRTTSPVIEAPTQAKYHNPHEEQANP